MDLDKYGHKQFEIERKSQICKIWKIWMARCHMMPASPPPYQSSVSKENKHTLDVLWMPEGPPPHPPHLEQIRKKTSFSSGHLP